jgi:hypothetical protein
MTVLLLLAEERWVNLKTRAADMSVLAPSSRYWHQSWNNHNFDPDRYAHRACLQTYWPRRPSRRRRDRPGAVTDSETVHRGNSVAAEAYWTTTADSRPAGRRASQSKSSCHPRRVRRGCLHRETGPRVRSRGSIPRVRRYYRRHVSPREWRSSQCSIRIARSCQFNTVTWPHPHMPTSPARCRQRGNDEENGEAGGGGDEA